MLKIYIGALLLALLVGVLVLAIAIAFYIYRSYRLARAREYKAFKAALIEKQIKITPLEKELIELLLTVSMTDEDRNYFLPIYRHEKESGWN